MTATYTITLWCDKCGAEEGPYPFRQQTGHSRGLNTPTMLRKDLAEHGWVTVGRAPTIQDRCPECGL